MTATKSEPGTNITQTISVQDGHGPYLWVLGYRCNRTKILSYVVFSHWTDADDYRRAVELNGNTVETLSLASNFCRRVATHD